MGGSKEGRGETLAEGDGVGLLDGLDSGAGGSSSGVADDLGCNELGEFVAAKLGGGDEGGKNVDVEGSVILLVTDSGGNRRTTHSSPGKNSAVNARCSRPRLELKTPPYKSLSRTVPNAVRFAVLYKAPL